MWFLVFFVIPLSMQFLIWGEKHGCLVADVSRLFLFYKFLMHLSLLRRFVDELEDYHANRTTN